MKIAGLEIQFSIRLINPSRHTDNYFGSVVGHHTKSSKAEYDNEIISLFKQGKPQCDIAKEMGVSQATISRRLKKHGFKKSKKNSIEISLPTKELVKHLEAKEIRQFSIGGKEYTID